MAPPSCLKGRLDNRAAACFTQPMCFYGLLDRENQDVIEFYPSREAAERELALILNDEPAWVERMPVVLVDFSGAEPVVTVGLRSSRG